MSAQKSRAVYVFLVKRPIDAQAWPCVPFEDRVRAQAYPHRASPVVGVTLEGDRAAGVRSMTQQLEFLGLMLDEQSARRLSLPQARPVKRPRLPLVDVPRAANADPETSHLAAARIRDSGALGEQQQHALALVRAHPGRTSAELSDIASKRGDGPYARMRSQLGRRLADLKGVHARQGEARVCSITRAKCVTWWPLENSHA